MIRYVIRRILHMIPVLFGVVLIIFTLLAITPGDPVRMIVGDDADQATITEVRQSLGLNDPIYLRFIHYVGGIIFHGDFGTSYVTKQPVSTELFERYPTTIILATFSTLIACIIAIPLGILSALKQNSLIDSLSRFFAILGISMPAFWHGLVNILIFAVFLKWFPVGGFSTPVHWILPAITIGTAGAAAIMRMTRSQMLETIRQDYIRTARAKGASERTVIWKHALRNAMIPVLTSIGIRFGASLSGSIITEQVFNIPGLGKLMIDSINNRNYPVIQGGVLLIALAYSIINLSVDLLYAFVDPRIKSQYSHGKKYKMAK